MSIFALSGELRVQPVVTKPMAYVRSNNLHCKIRIDNSERFWVKEPRQNVR